MVRVKPYGQDIEAQDILIMKLRSQALYQHIQ